MTPGTTPENVPGSSSGATSGEADAAMHLVLIDGSGFIFRAFHALPHDDTPGRHAGQRGVRLHQHAGASF